MEVELAHIFETVLRVFVLKEISSVTADYFHQLRLKHQCKKLSSVVICVSYRPSECHLSRFENNLEPSYIDALLLNKPILILEDLNCNEIKRGSEAKSLENFMFEMNLEQSITTPTRITVNENEVMDMP